MRNLKEVNTVTCLKLVWKIVSSHSSLWVDWLKAYLIRKGSFWSINANTQAGSLMWRKILRSRELAKKFHKVEIKSGKNTSFWHDPWNPIGRISDVLGERGYIELGISKTATVEEVILKHRRRRHRTDILNIIEDAIDYQRTKSRTHDLDVALWKKSSNTFKASFNSSDTWNQVRQKEAIKAWTKCVWFSNATPKFSFLMWLAMKNRLSTGDRMQR